MGFKCKQLKATSGSANVNGPSATNQDDLLSVAIVYLLALNQAEVDEYLEITKPADVDQSLHSARILAARLLAQADCDSFEGFVELCQKFDPSGTDLPINGPRQEDLKLFIDDALSAVPVVEVYRAEHGKAFATNQSVTE